MSKPKQASNGASTPPSVSPLLAPFSQEAEEATVGAVLISPQVFESIMDFLQPDDFYLTRHRYLWEVFFVLHGRREIMDLTTISEELRLAGRLDDIGGYAYLIHLIGNTPNSMHAEAYGRLVQRTSVRRKLLTASDRIREDAMNEEMPIEVVMGNATRTVLDVADVNVSAADQDVPIEEAIQRKAKQLRDDITLYQKNKHYVKGIRTGLEDLDTLLDGLSIGITTLAGATGSGKTALVLGMTLYASQKGIYREVEAPAKTLFFSGEMTEDQIMNRTLGQMTGIPVRSIQRGGVTQDEVMQLNAACNRLIDEHELTLVSVKRLSTGQIRSRVRSRVAQGELDLVVLDGLLEIDELQMDTRGSKRQRQYADAKRRDAIQNIMLDLEDISLTYKTPILLTHQISRNAANRKNNRPQLSDLAEASFVEQKSAAIIFLYRDAYYNPETADPNAAEIIVAKSRHGSTGTVHAVYQADMTRFLSADKHHVSFYGDDD